MTHTPTPWTPDTTRIIGADGSVVCYSSAFGALNLISDADAKLIVLAVNNHSRLLSMLEDVTEQFENDDQNMRCIDNIVLNAARRLLNDLTASQPPHTT